MTNKLFLDSGYINMGFLICHEAPFTILTGGRGTGKTYGATKWLYENKTKYRKFLWLRRTEKGELDSISKTQFSPFVKYCLQEHKEFPEVTKEGNLYTVYSPNKEEVWGYMGALSTFSNLRGMEGAFAEVDVIIYDEFIPEKHKSKMSGEYEAIINLYETICRNRELEGGKPVKMLFMANAFNVANPLFRGLGIVDHVCRMQESGQEKEYLKERGLYLVCLRKSRISELKKEKTALGKLGIGEEFENEIYNNSFYVDTRFIKPIALKGWLPVVQYGEMCIYTNKQQDTYYIGVHPVGKLNYIPYGSKQGDKAFTTRYSYLYMNYIQYENIIFESISAKVLFENSFF